MSKQSCWSFLFCFSFLLLLAACAGETTNPESGIAEKEVFCDAEMVEGEYLLAKNGALLDGASQRSSEKSKSGKYSIRLDDKSKYGFGYDLPELIAGPLQVTVWVNVIGPLPSLVLRIDGQEDFISNYSIKTEGEWRLVELYYEVPETVTSKSAKIFLWNNNGNTAYCDDFGLAFTDSVDLPELPLLDLRLSEKAWNKILAKREEALSKGILQTSGKDEVDAQLIVNGQDTLNAETRLKGDWVDHLSGDKWSFRIKLKGDGAFMGMRKFSVQDPKVRNYLNEWVFHEMLQQEGILAGKYDFVRLKINGEDKGVFNIEEHFAKELLESQARREGPILKFNEDGWWASLLANELQYSPTQQIKDYNSAEIEAFGMKRILRDSILKEHFLNGRDKLHQLQRGKGDIASILDLDKMARFVAITDVCGAHHGFVWHNFRFYFNPISQLLEPIGFDGYGGIHGTKYDLLTCSGALNDAPIPNDTHEIKSLLSRDRTFVEKYIGYLQKYSDAAFIDQFIADKEETFAAFTRVLHRDDPNFKASWFALKLNARFIRNALHLGKRDDLKIYRPDNKNEIELRNFHALPIEILGLGNAQTIIRKYESTPILHGYKSDTGPATLRLRALGPGKHIYARVIGTNEPVRIKIKPYGAAQSELNHQSEKQSIPTDMFSIQGKTILAKKGHHVIDQTVTIPVGSSLQIFDGTSFEFRSNASLISYGPININGTQDQPVRFSAAANSRSGIAIMQTDEVSHFGNVIFEGLSTPSNAFTGAVNFYEADIYMKACLFNNNNSEDGLNVVRSKINFNDIHFNNTFSDAFDCDFCTGAIHGVYVNTSGNDALDFSGSQLRVISAELINAGDKGFSCGEASTIKIDDCRIDGSKMAITAKDNSQVTVTKATIKNSNFGFVAYQKKPVYGPANIIVEDYEFKAVAQDHLIEQNSTLDLMGDRISGGQVVDISLK